MTVAEIDGLLYLPNRTRRDLRRALRIPALSEGSQGSFRELLEQAPDGEVAALAWEGLRPLRVVAIEHESASVISVRLTPAGGEPAAPALPGQFLTVRLRPDPTAPALLRPTHCRAFRTPTAIASASNLNRMARQAATCTLSYASGT